ARLFCICQNPRTRQIPHPVGASLLAIPSLTCGGWPKPSTRGGVELSGLPSCPAWKIASRVFHPTSWIASKLAPTGRVQLTDRTKPSEKEPHTPPAAPPVITSLTFQSTISTQ